MNTKTRTPIDRTSINQRMLRSKIRCHTRGIPVSELSLGREVYFLLPIRNGRKLSWRTGFGRIKEIREFSAIINYDDGEIEIPCRWIYDDESKVPTDWETINQVHLMVAMSLIGDTYEETISNVIKWILVAYPALPKRFPLATQLANGDLTGITKADLDCLHDERFACDSPSSICLHIISRMSRHFYLSRDAEGPLYDVWCLCLDLITKGG